jgi:hypothetical protein
VQLLIWVNVVMGGIRNNDHSPLVITQNRSLTMIHKVEEFISNHFAEIIVAIAVSWLALVGVGAAMQ